MLNIIVVIQLLLAASGDVEAILATPPQTLTAPQKSKLATAILSVFPSAITATVERFYCVRDKKTGTVACDGSYKRRAAESDFIDLALKGKAGKAYTGAPEGQIDFLQLAPRTEAKAPAIPSIRDFVESTFTGVAINLILDFGCARSVEDSSVVKCRAAYYDEVSAATYVTLLHTGYVVRPIRRVP